MKQILLIITLLFSFKTMAQSTDSGTLNLSGAIGQVVSISIAAEAVASTLDLAVTQTDLLVASVTENSNTALGYDITISSLNDSNLKRNGGTEVIGYTIKYNGVGIDISASSASPVNAKSNGTGGIVSEVSQVQISYTGVDEATQTAGIYQDTLTIEIAARQ